MTRADIIVSGLVQGVGFRHFVTKQARRLGLVGWTRNLPSGEVRTVAEGPREKIEELYGELRRGPAGARVSGHDIEWMEATGEFDSFDVRR